MDRQFNLPNGLYHVTVTDAEGCSEVRPASVLLPKPSPELPEEFEYNLPRFLIKDLNSNANLDSCVEVSGSNLAYLDKVNFGIGWSFWGPEFKSVEVVHPSVNYNLNFTVNSNWLDFHWESTTFSLSSAVPLFKLCFESQEASAFNNFIRFRRGYSTPRMVHETEGDLGFIGVNGQVNYGSGSLDYSTFSGARLFQPSCEADGYRRIALDEPDYQYVVANGAIDNVNFYDDDQFLFAKAGEYTVQKSIGNSYFSELYAYIPPYSLPTSECVWPGDADNNNVVNHFDLLYLGLGIGAGHEPRLNGDEIWQGDDSNDWPQSTARRHINFKNFDTNGDGLINQSDTSAIYKHWTQAIRKFDRTSPWALPAPLDTVIEQTRLELLADTISTGTTVLIPVSLSASGIQGLAFSISYDSSLIADAPRFIPASSWLGTPGNLLDVQKDFPGQSRLDVAITRINQFAVSGSGVIGHIEFKYKLLPADSLLKTHLFATRVIAITPDEQLIGFSDTRKPVILKGGVVSGVLGDSRGLGEFKVSPNPASDVVWVESEYELIDRIEVIHVGGAILSKISPDFPSQNVAVKLDFLPSGVYFLKLFCKNNVFLTRIVKGSE
ncbi:MAG: T9SS type A sorting domain-containing protein [Saprospiraceae bacterium]|nr:T9SS type A sorting domain-containing protein [Saprospiraceae bacterium]